MSYLLDTNVISEMVRPKPSPRVLRWLGAVPDAALYLSVLSLGEIRKGVERLPQGKRREALRLWLEQDLPAWFEDRLLSVDHLVADLWGRLIAGRDGAVPAIDSLLAATALHHQLRLVTRNGQDFQFPGLETIDPWQV